MKKLQLSLQNIKGKEMLTREQLKKITGGGEGSGGSGDSSCSVSCRSGYYACCGSYPIFSERCRCVKDDAEADCDNGGPGSSSCSYSG